MTRPAGENRPRQIALDLGHAPGLSADDLVVSPANAEAIALVRRWPDWPGPVVVLAGPPGSGKSHLASVWRDLSGAAAAEPSALREAVAQAAAGVPISLDGLIRGGLDEASLFHLINAAMAGGAQILLTSRSFPAAWDVTLPDLRSRLKAAVTVEIMEPDDALLAGVMTKLFADRQVAVDPAVVDYLIRRIERSLATAIDLVDRLDRAALERGGGITRALAAEIVSALDEGQGSLDL